MRAIRRLIVPSGEVYKVGQDVIYEHGQYCVYATIRGISRRGPKFKLEILGNPARRPWLGQQWVMWDLVQPSLEGDEDE